MSHHKSVIKRKEKEEEIEVKKLLLPIQIATGSLFIAVQGILRSRL